MPMIFKMQVVKKDGLVYKIVICRVINSCAHKLNFEILKKKCNPFKPCGRHEASVLFI